MVYVERSTITGCNILLDYNKQTKNYLGFCFQTKTFRVFKLKPYEPFSAERDTYEIVEDLREVSFDQDFLINCAQDNHCRDFRARLQLIKIEEQDSYYSFVQDFSPKIMNEPQEGPDVRRVKNSA